MKRLLLLSALSAGISSPALAEVKTSTEGGFSVLHKAEVSATPDIVWKRLVAPKLWWSKDHSWSGSVAGFTIDPKAGGCFCEAIQEKGADGKIATVGTVEHMRVIYAHPGKVLRMQGALGPLQGEAVLGTLTIAMEANKDRTGTTVSFSYVVGGYMRQKSDAIAAGVDKVIGEQFKTLVSPWVVGAEKGKLNLDVEALTEGQKERRALLQVEDTTQVPEVELTGEAAKETPPKEKPKPKVKLPDGLKPLPPGEDGNGR